MRLWPTVLVLAALAPSGAAVAVDDPPDDVQYDYRNVGRQPAPPIYPETDILHAEWLEGADNILASVQTRGADGTGITPPIVASYMTFGGVEHRIRWLGNGEAYLQVRTGPESWSDVTEVAASADRTGGTWNASVPKLAIRNDQARHLHAGDALTGLWAAARQFGVAAQVVDETAKASTPFVVETAAGQAGHLAVVGTTVRHSNGGPDFFIFDLLVQNTASEADTVAVSLEGMPSGWAGVGPELVEIGAQSVHDITIAIAVPFQHVHGEEERVTLVLESGHDPLVRLERPLTVSYVHPPDPAGHHDRVFFHAHDTGQATLGTDWRVWSNAIEKDEADAGGIVHTRGGHDFAQWTIPLEPAPRVGLVVDPDGRGTARLAFEPREAFPIPGANLEVGLFLCAPGRTDGDHDCAGGRWGKTLTGHVDLAGVDVTRRFVAEVPLEPTSFSGVFPPGDNFHAEWRIILRGDETWVHVPELGNAPGFVTDGSYAVLPLVDYHDAVVGRGQPFLAGDPAVRAGGEVWVKLANPGALDIVVVSAGAGWAEVVRHGEGLWLALTPPADAVPASLLLVGRQDETVVAYQAVDVRLDAAAPDSIPKGAVSRSAEPQKSPVPAVYVVAALALGLLRRRL